MRGASARCAKPLPSADLTLGDAAATVTASTRAWSLTGTTDMTTSPATGFVTFGRGTHAIYGTGATVEEAYEHAVDAIRDICVSRFRDDAEALRAFKATKADLDTYPATAALIEAVEQQSSDDWEISDGAACTYAEAHGNEMRLA